MNIAADISIMHMLVSCSKDYTSSTATGFKQQLSLDNGSKPQLEHRNSKNSFSNVLNTKIDQETTLADDWTNGQNDVDKNINSANISPTSGSHIFYICI